MWLSPFSVKPRENFKKSYFPERAERVSFLFGFGFGGG